MNINPTNTIERRFTATLNQLAKQIERAFEIAATPQMAVMLINRYAQSQEYKDWCDKLALAMTTQVNKGVSKTWREAARKAGRGSEIYDALMQELKSPYSSVFWLKVQDNAKLIKTFLPSVPVKLTEHIAQETARGRRAEDILSDMIAKYPTIAKSRLMLIARTEASKTQTALIQSRAQRLGLDWYIWRTSQDARVRKSHEHMDGVLVKWSDPPSPEELKNLKSYGKYHAGDIFNCRCYPEPIVNLNYVDFPAKVYTNGKIKLMSRAEFEKLIA